MEKGESTTVNVVTGAETSSERKGKAPLLAVPVAAEQRISRSGVIELPENANGRYKRIIAIFDLILRLGAIITLLCAAVLMATSDETLPFFNQFFQFQASYDDMPAFPYFVIANSIVCGYLLVSIPLSIVCIIRPHAAVLRLILIILDVVMLALETSAAASAKAIADLAQNGNTKTNWFAICQQFQDFCGKVGTAVMASFISVVIFVLLIVLSALALRKN